MARLNEVPMSTESIESLKRRFLRQNRDIARVNSTQSLRIRNLENETSRLLAENLGLQEQILRLQSELENGQSQRLAEHAQDVKSQLEVKLLEIGAIINTLQDDPPRKKSSRAEAITNPCHAGSPDQRNWRNICTLSEAIGGQGDRLPTIVEHKTYPRKTLEQRELLDIISDADAGVDATGSPDIGPPPVSQFVDEDPVKIDLPQRSHKKEVGEPISIDPALSINLEHRKKRKDNTSSNELNLPTSTEPAQTAQASKTSLKTGAKRKFSVREDEEYESRASSRVDSSPDNFEFTRVISNDKKKNSVEPPLEKTSTKLMRELAVARGVAREKHSSAGISTTRKALAPKSANDSPRKTTRAQPPDEIKTKQPDVPKFNSLKDRPREKESEAVHNKPQNESSQNTIEAKRGPETPAGVGTLSPPPSRQSTVRAETRDTPPPPDLEGHRPSRRARGSVSYAEPNLRDKMRRPTKELADAVTGDSNSRRSISSKQTEDQALNHSAIKAELEEEGSWKRMPLASSATVENSPLRTKAPGSESDALPSSITTHRKRRESILHHVELDRNKSGSETAISALIAEHRKAKAAVREKAFEKEGNLEKAIEKLDIYDFNASSSPQAPPTKAIKERKTALKSSKRQSSTPHDIEVIGNGEVSDIEALKAREAPVSRRRQSTLGLRSSSTNGQAASEKQLPAKRHLNSTGTAGVVAGDTRSDRILARRRSMML